MIEPTMPLNPRLTAQSQDTPHRIAGKRKVQRSCLNPSCNDYAPPAASICSVLRQMDAFLFSIRFCRNVCCMRFSHPVPQYSHPWIIKSSMRRCLILQIRKSCQSRFRQGTISVHYQFPRETSATKAVAAFLLKKINSMSEFGVERLL